MQYYQLIMDGGDENDRSVVALSREKINDYDLYKGQKIENWNENTIFEYDPDEGDTHIEYLATNISHPIMTEKAVKALEKLIANDVQLLPIRVINKKTGEEPEKYYILNILSCVDALDLQNSLYDRRIDDRTNEEYISVIKYALDSSRVGEHHIFRIKESVLSVSVFVSEEFRKVVRKNKMKGMEIYKVKTI